MSNKKMKKETKDFARELKSDRIKFTKLLNPRVCYTSEYDIFDINWGDKKVNSTIELNLCREGDLRFDLDKNNIIVGIEVEDFSEVLKKFDCDKNKAFKKEIEKINKKLKKQEVNNGET